LDKVNAALPDWPMMSEAKLKLPGDVLRFAADGVIPFVNTRN
jgi:hypothetical protein